MEINVNNYKGLNQDVGYDVIQDAYVDAQNIRISTTKGKSGGSWTNIKGQTVFFILPDGDALTAVGYKEIIGYTTIRNIIILFVADDSGTNGWIYKILYDESLNYVSTTLLYANAGLNFNKERPIKALGRYENDNIQRVFWSDYEEFLRSINIADPNLISQPLGQIDIFPSVAWTQPIIKDIQPGGNLLNGVYQVSYKLTTIDGKETLISPPSNIVHITPTSEGNASDEYVGGLKGINSNKSILVKIDTTNYTDFDTIVVYLIFNDTLNGTPQVFEAEVLSIAGATSIECLITGNEFVSNVSLDEYTSKTLPFKTVKTLTQKDGSLVVANIKEVRVSIQDLLEVGEIFDVSTLRYLSDGVTACANSFNEEYNKDAHWSGDWHTSQQYKYQSDGVTLGGESPNLSYKFYLESTNVDEESFAFNSFVNPANPGAPNLDNYTYYNTSYPSVASPQLSGLIRGFKRGETYRMGIVGYTAKGEVTFVEFVGDIKFPDISDQDGANNNSGTPFFPLSGESAQETFAYNLGLEFTIDFTSCPSLLTKLSGWQVVRVQRTDNDKRRITSGILNTFHSFAVGTAGPDYDFSAPNGSDDIYHLYGGKGNQGNFAYLQNQANPVLTANSLQVIGDAFCYYSPELSFNFNNFRTTINGLSNCYMLVTGAYIDYINTNNTRYNSAHEVYNSSGTEDLGQITDIRKKLPTVVPIDKTTIKAPYDNITYNSLSRGVEYVRKIDKKQFALFTNQLDNTPLDFDVVTGPYTLTSGTVYLRNYFVNLADDITARLNEPNNNIESILFKNASGLHGNLNYVDIDPLTGDILSPYSNEHCFKGGTIGGSTGFVEPVSPYDFEESRPIIDILLAKSEIYGGFTDEALRNNTFIPCSPVYPMTELTPKVFGGDTFLMMWTFQEASTWNERTFYDLASANTYKYTKQRTVTTHIVVESTINIELNYGSTVKQGVKYSVYGGSGGVEHERYRQETNNSYRLHGLFAEMYKYNEVYSRENKDLSFFTQPRNAQNINYVNDVRSYLSNVKTNGELIDSWTKFGILNFWDVDDYGPINEILNWKNYVYFFQDRAFGTLSVNPRALVTPNDGQITELGSAQGIVDHLYISEVHGSIHQWAIKATDTAIYFYDTLHRKIFMFQGSNTPLSEIKGLHSFLNNLPASINNRKENGGDNPILFSGVHIGRDFINDEVLFTFLTSGDAEYFLEANGIYPDNALVSYEYQGERLVRRTTEAYVSSNTNYAALITQLISKSEEYTADYTLVFDELQQEFSSFYSFKPQIYVENNNLLLSPPAQQSNLGVSGLFKHNNGNYGTFYSFIKESYIQLIINPKSEINKVLRFLEFTSIVKTDAQVISRLESITAFRIHNEYQDTGKVTISSSNLKRKFDKWRIKIPRDINSTNQRGRLRSSYFIVTLYYNNSTNKELIMNRLFSYYDIQIF